MNMWKVNILVLFATFTCYIGFSQTGTIKGKVEGFTVDDYIILNLFNANDSTIEKTAICDEEGNFELESVKFGQYFILINSPGFEKYKSLDFALQDSILELSSIMLQAIVTQVDEVEAVAKVPFVIQKMDRVVINPDALIGNSGTTALDVLEKAPGITVDMNGNISFKGKPGVMVFIDNKPSYLSSSDLAAYLRSIPSSSIETIELMANPPAGYDAAGNAGIINIRLKRSKVKGFNGGVNLSYGQGRYYRTNNSLNLNYRINKLNFFGNISVSQNNSYHDLTINRYYFDSDGNLNSSYNQNSYIKSENGGRNARFGMDWYMTEKSTIGFALSGFMNPSYGNTTNQSRILDESNVETALVRAESISDKIWKNGSANLNFMHQFDKNGKELSVNVDYLSYKVDQDQSLQNSIYSPNNVLDSQTLLISKLPADISIQSAKLDYAHPFKNGSKIDVGLKSSLVSTDNDASFFDVVDNVSSPNYEFTNRFKYAENINAAYIDYSKEWNKFGFQFGLRVENTELNGKQFGNAQLPDSSFKRSYTGLFPTVFLSYQFDTLQNNQLLFSAGRRIDRPDYQDLNPFTYPLDRYTYYEGNPFLLPTYSYNFSLSHVFKNMLTTSVEYSYMDNLISETNEQRDTIYYSRPGNFGRQEIFGFSVNGSVTITKWWTLQFYTEAKNIKINSTIYNQLVDEQKWYWWVGPLNQFALGKTTSAEIGGSYQTRILVGQFLTVPVWQIRFGVAQKVLKGNGTIKLNLSDVFHSQRPGGDIRNIQNSKAEWFSKLDSQVLTLSFSYRFNKGQGGKSRQTGSSDEEKQRLRTN